MSKQNVIMIYVAAFLAVFAEATLPGLREWLGAQVDLLPALMVYTALYASLANVGLLAVLGGLWFDSLSANPLGISIPSLFITGVAIFTQRDLILRDLPFAQMVLGAAASALAPLGTVLIMLSAGKTLLLGWGSLWQWVVMIAGGSLATPVVFAVFNWFDHAFGYKVRTESSFRPDREIRRSRL
jgi:rod shape-determining protein MreD